VARSDDEADMQKDGVDVIAQMFEDDQAELAAAALSPDSEDEGEEAGEEAAEAAPEATETAEQDDTETKE
jgi:large subunit ribosomal protein L9